MRPEGIRFFGGKKVHKRHHLVVTSTACGIRLPTHFIELSPWAVPKAMLCTGCFKAAERRDQGSADRPADHGV